MNEKPETFHYPYEVIATDDAGNNFPKQVELHYDVSNAYDKWNLDFGGWSNYDATHLCEHWIKRRPEKKPFCIDMGGRNHKGSPNVCITHDVTDSIIEWAQQIMGDHQEWIDIQEAGFVGTFADYQEYKLSRGGYEKKLTPEDELPF